MTDTSHDPMLDRYLADVARRLGHLPRSQRDDVLAGLRDHIAELRDAGVAPEEIVVQLGSPESIADAASSELPPRRPRFWDTKRWVQFVAVALSIRVAWMTLFTPMYSGTSSWESSDGTRGEEAYTQTVAEANGWPLALMVAAIPLALTVAPALSRGKSRQTVTVVCTALLAGVSILAGFSVGPLYVLPLVAAVCACLVPPTRHDPRHALAPIGLGIALVAFWLGWNNRLGPGEVCTGTADLPATHCTTYVDPSPFATVGALALLVAAGLAVWARRRPRAASTGRGVE